MIRASVALWPKTSAKAPPQEPCPGSKAAKARGRKLARRRWQQRKELLGEVARSAGLMSRERGNNRFLPLAHRLINAARPRRRRLRHLPWRHANMDDASFMLTLWFLLVVPLRHKVA